MKKVISLILSMAMVLSLTVLSFANTTTGTYSITINNSTSGHTYEAYQIFIGELSGKNLSNIKWGSGVTNDAKTALGDASSKAATLINETNAKDFAKELVDGSNNTTYLSSTYKTATEPNSEGKYVIDGLAPGYYLVKETGTITGNDAYTDYILKVVDDEVVEPKTGIPQVEKKVKDINDSIETTLSDWQDSADHDINDVVEFQLTGTIGENYDRFDTYQFIFHDNLSNGLTFNSSSVKAYVVNGTTKQEIPKDKYSVATSDLEQDCDFEVRFTDLKTITTDVNGSEISITTGSKIVVEYNATLNENAIIGSVGNPNDVYLEYSNNPHGNQTGNTEKDTVIVFTYKVIINKVDGTADKGEDGRYPDLKGAQFKLEKFNAKTNQYELVKEYTADGQSVFEFKGLDDGKYKLTETKNPTGYNKIDPIEFEVVATHDANGLILTDLNGNKLSGQISFTKDVSKGLLTADVENNKGPVLPSTGGIGTTIFYVVGAALVIGAGVLFITKRRMSTR